MAVVGTRNPCVVRRALSFRSCVRSQPLGRGLVYPLRRCSTGVDSRGWKEWATTGRYPFGVGAAEATVTEAPEESTSPTGAPAEVTSSQKLTGLLHNLPNVMPPDEHVASAVKKARRLGRNQKLIGPAAQAKNLAARQMDRLMKELTVPLTTYLRRFPVRARLHRFEAALLDLTVEEERYLKVLARVLQLRKTATAMGKEYAGRGGKADSKKEAERVAEEGFAALEALFQKHRGVLIDLVTVARALRRLPKLDHGIPTLALVGAPNVGKSSLVQAISSGRPEICNYPFTTRSIKMGHFYVDGRRHQVTDTPGLLNRPDDEKNSMELLTVATLQFLPTAVVFVLDATEQCGTSLSEQLEIRAGLRERFPQKQWIDVLSKSDLLGDAIQKGGFPNTLREALQVSCVTEEGMHEFKERLMQVFTKS